MRSHARLLAVLWSALVVSACGGNKDPVVGDGNGGNGELAVPDAPTGPTATAGDGSATVRWTAPANNGGAAITGYAVTPYAGGNALAVSTADASAAELVISGLTNGTEYSFKIAAQNSVGTGPASAATNAVTPAALPGAPTNVVAARGNAQASVTWFPPSSSGGGAITGFVINAYFGTTLVSSTPVNDAAATAAMVTGLTNGTAYTFTVAAKSAVGTGPESSPSGPTTPATVPGAPMAPTVMAGNTQVTVGWTAPADNGGSAVTGFVVTPYQGSTARPVVNITDPLATGTTVSGLTNGVAYTFKFAAKNALGTGAQSGASSASTPQPGVPGAPTNVTGVAGHNRVTLTWAAPTNNGGSSLTQYLVTPYIGAAAQTTTQVNAAYSSWIITGLTDNTGYTFTVTATNSAGSGAPSAPSAVITPVPTAPDVPPLISATAGDQQVSVTWVAPSNDGGSPITSYTLTLYDTSGPKTPVNVPASPLSYVASGLTNGMQYYFRITANNAVGNGTQPNYSNAVTPAAPPSAPTNVNATAGAARATVTWTAPANNGAAITGYTVTPYIGAAAQTASNFGAVTTASVRGLTNGTAYTFRVAATNSMGTGAQSAASNSVTPLPNPPGAPTDVIAVVTGTTQVTVAWSGPGDSGGAALSGFSITPYIGTTAQTPVAVANGNARSFKVTGLTQGTEYTFTVTATNSGGNGPVSAKSNPATPAAPCVSCGFPGPKLLSTGTGPGSLLSADVNADGVQDIVTANASATVSVLLGNGNGTFGLPIDSAAGTYPSDLAIADLDADGKLDVVTANYNGSNVSVLLGNGNGTFKAPANYATDSLPTGITLGDFNGDGKSDIAASTRDTGNVSVLLNLGNGTFGTKTSYATAASTGASWSIVNADFNGDGYNDLLTSNFYRSSVSLLKGNGNGTFQPFVEFSAGLNPISVVVADFNADGKPDFATANYSSANVTVGLGNGDGTFGTRVPYVTSGNTAAISVGDLDGDGKTDIISGNVTGGTVGVLMGNGNGTFQLRKDYVIGGVFGILNQHSLLILDANQDGKPDLFAPVGNYSSQGLVVAFGAGAGTFVTGKTYATANSPIAAVTGDFDRDGFQDVLTLNSASPYTMSLMGGNGDGTLRGRTDFNVSRSPGGIAAGDLNGDGKLDVVTTSGFDNNVGVLMGQGNGNFQAKVDVVVGANTVKVALGDVNKDGIVDLVTTPQFSSVVHVLLGNGDGTFAAKVDYATSSIPNKLVVRDFNNDGAADIAVLSASTINVLVANGDGTFAPRFTLAAGGTATGLEAADIDGSGKVSLVATNNLTNNNVVVFVGNGNGTFQAAVTYAATGMTLSSVTAVDVFGTGKPSLVVLDATSGRMGVLANNGDGTFQAPQNWVAAVGAGALVSTVLDANGKPDLIYVTSSADTVSALPGVCLQ
ncbi:MAG: beta strand repeat-containing protein [Myxococcaceae bacterium]